MARCHLIWLAPGAAAAQDCYVGAHCYAIARWDVSSTLGSGFLGGKVTLRSNCMTTPNHSSAFVTNEMWAAKHTTNGDRWVEIGIFIGYSPEGIANDPMRFWAEMKSSGYHEHTPGFAYTEGTYLTVTAHAPTATSASWEVWFGASGTRYTSVDGIAAPARILDTGVEVIEDDAHTFGSTTDMKFYDLADNLTNGWSGTSTSASYPPIQDPGMTAVWMDYPNWLRAARGPAC